MELHFQTCNDRRFAENTVCYIRVSDADALQGGVGKLVEK